jgi:hypothetical protein
MTPAISRSELVRTPSGFLSDTTWAVMSAGNSNSQTKGGMA